MKIKVRSLNAVGLATLEQWLIGREGAPPRHVLEVDGMTENLADDYEIDASKEFTTSFELGLYLHDQVSGVVEDSGALLAQHGMWSWLSLAFISSLVQKRGKDAGKPLAAPHYVNTPRLSYRLIARTAWDLVRRHGEDAKVALGSLQSPWGEMAEQLAGRQEMYGHKSFWPVANRLYLSPAGSAKAGATTQRNATARRDPKSRAGLGGVRRLPFTFKQFERTYNLRQMDGGDIVALLPPEYDRWKTV
jgi:hypothetical protein